MRHNNIDARGEVSAASKEPIATTVPVNLQNERVLRTSDVVAITSLSKAQLYRMMDAGSFPARIRLSARRGGWIASDVKAWLVRRRQETANLDTKGQP